MAIPALATLMIGCDDAERNARSAPPAAAEPAPTPASMRASTAARDTILFLGTSLTAGYGLAPQQAYPAILQEKLDSAGLPYHVVNAGVSGETSAGALRRVDWLLRQPFDVLVIETGANDMLRGANLGSVRENIQRIIDRVRERRGDSVRIVLAGMMAPPNLGGPYANSFRQIYEDVARVNDIPLIPFLLEGVGGVTDLNLPDGVHPNARGQQILAENVWLVLEPTLRQASTRGP
jgi:acyl-CoA thioesterase-1